MVIDTASMAVLVNSDFLQKMCMGPVDRLPVSGGLGEP